MIFPFSVTLVAGQFRPLVGGAERQSERLAAELLKQGHSVEVVTRLLEKDHPRCEIVLGVPVRRLGSAGTGLFRLRKLERAGFALQLWRELRGSSVSRCVLVQHLLYPALVAGLATGGDGWPLVVRVSSTGTTSDFKMWGGLSAAVHRFLRSRVSTLVVLNEQARVEAMERGYSADRIVIIPNGVDVSVEPEPRTHLGAAQVIYVGGLRSEKRVDVLIEAWKKAATKGSLSIVGEGPERSRLEALSAGSRVCFLGRVEDPSSHQRAADVAVLSSDAEGMSNALIEAMAAGCACVATYIGGNVDCLFPGSTEPADGTVSEGPFGWLVRRGDIVALALALKRLDEGPEIRSRLGAAARARALSEYSIAAAAARYSDLFTRLLRERTPPT
ncbi:MAG: glycosyltransferase [Vicinamibacteria bacterium]